MPLETTGRRKKQKSAQGPQKIQRRKVFAFIAAGGVAAAGAAVFLNFGHIVGTPAAKPGDQKNMPTPANQQQANGMGKPAAQAPNQQQNNPPQSGQMNMQDAPNAIGSTKQMGNSSADFTNPADKKMALLIHLPSGSFAAYERACTHEGVNVNYDPATKMLVCPAHGAIFDPAKNGSVVQGPAEQPLPPVHIKVNGDGTITAV
jgi:Rieske Fe-S protein